ncbi:2-oxo-4-hydroxy-4-carboxy-5-ureidoimidazoline decarboxylase [Paenibacillus sp. GCM10023252]|uniref:2-oxo-4-hydroxy-4-carboxy-5-ureidoimidazoline decarboxylase n=1 Tax=Paenibacillus sp. GCM10023252 TaxID=3252649 RepID=UPI00360C0E21
MSKMTKLTLDQVNGMNAEEFNKTLGWIVEHSPWVIEGVEPHRPFSSIQQFHDELVKLIMLSSTEQKLHLLRQHPDLGSRMQMTAASVSEQKGAGLDQLNPTEYDQLLSLNKQYVSKFGFPFILSVRGHTKESILAALSSRLNNEGAAELEEALQQIARITRLRMEDLVLT